MRVSREILDRLDLQEEVNEALNTKARVMARRDFSPPTNERVCLICGVHYIANSRNQKWCSYACKREAWDEREQEYLQYKDATRVNIQISGAKLVKLMKLMQARTPTDLVNKVLLEMISRAERASASR